MADNITEATASGDHPRQGGDVCRGSFSHGYTQTVDLGVGICNLCEQAVPLFTYEPRHLGGGMVEMVPKGKHLSQHAAHSGRTVDAASNADSAGITSW